MPPATPDRGLPDAYRMHPLTLRFAGELERRFNEAQLPRYVGQARQLHVIGFVATVILLPVLERMVVPEAVGPLRAVIGVLLCATLGMFACSFTAWFRRAHTARHALQAAFSSAWNAVALVVVMWAVRGDGQAIAFAVAVFFVYGASTIGAAYAACVVVMAATVAATLGAVLAFGTASAAVTLFGGILIVVALVFAEQASRLMEGAVRRTFVQQLLLDAERATSERLLLNVLPAPIAARLKAGEAAIADRYDECTVLFADIVGYTGLTRSLAPAEMVGLLNRIFSAFDALAAAHGLEKIKTIGDGYHAVAGVPIPRPDHAEAAAAMALAMRDAVRGLAEETGWPLRVRIGLDTGGPVLAGIIGTRKFSFDLWGDVVNTAARMESHGVADHIQGTERVHARLRHAFAFEERGVVEAKGLGPVRTYLLLGTRAPAPASRGRGRDTPRAVEPTGAPARDVPTAR